jgi:dCTP deaminase
MTFWSGETLADRLPSLITPFDAAQIDCAAYRLRVGPEAYVSPTGESNDAATKTKVSLDLGEAFTVPPGQFAFLLTEERVKVPNNALAFISVRATVKFRGLVNVSGFHVDPGYNGRLVFSVFNAGPGSVHLARGDDCFLIWYADLDRETALAKSGPGFHDIPTKLINPIAGEIQSFAGLLAKIKATEKRMDTISHEQNLVRVIGLIIVAALVGWFIREATVLRAVPAAPAIGQAAPAPAVPTGRADPGPALPTQPLTQPEGSAITITPQAPQPTTPRQ